MPFEEERIGRFLALLPGNTVEAVRLAMKGRALLEPAAEAAIAGPIRRNRGASRARDRRRDVFIYYNDAKVRALV